MLWRLAARRRLHQPSHRVDTTPPMCRGEIAAFELLAVARLEIAIQVRLDEPFLFGGNLVEVRLAGHVRLLDRRSLLLGRGAEQEAADISRRKAHASPPSPALCRAAMHCSRRSRSRCTRLRS